MEPFHLQFLRSGKSALLDRITSLSHTLLLKLKGLFKHSELASIWKESTGGEQRPKAPYGITDF